MQNINFGKKQDTIDIDKFCAQIKIRIQRRLGTKFHVTVQELVKKNGIKLRELIITEQGCKYSRSICLTCYYTKYQENKNLDEIENNIIDIYKRNK